MSVARLMAQLDHARRVRYDPRDDTLLAWFGGHGIHVFDATGREIAMFNVGDFSMNDASVEAVERAMVDYLSDEDFQSWRS